MPKLDNRCNSSIGLDELVVCCAVKWFCRTRRNFNSGCWMPESDCLALHAENAPLQSVVLVNTMLALYCSPSLDLAISMQRQVLPITDLRALLARPFCFAQIKLLAVDPSVCPGCCVQVVCAPSWQSPWRMQLETSEDRRSCDKAASADPRPMPRLGATSAGRKTPPPIAERAR